MGSGCGSCQAEIRNVSFVGGERCIDFSVPYTQKGGSCEADVEGTNRCDGDLVFPAVNGRGVTTVTPGRKFRWGTEVLGCGADKRCVVDATLKGRPVQFAFDIVTTD